MPVNTNTRYIVYNQSGSGVRQHLFSTQNDIIKEVHGTAATGTNMIAFGIPVLQHKGVDVPFAFMSVNGGSDGNKLYISPGNQNVPVGASDINILVVYDNRFKT